MEKKLCSQREQSVAGMLEGILRQHGLHPRPLSTVGFFSGAGADQWYDVWVPEEEEDRAITILTEIGYNDILAGK